VQTAEFAGRLMNPWDLILSPPGQSAVAQTVQAGNAVGRYVGEVVKSPDKAKADLKDAAINYWKSVDPTATSVADTTLGELQRRTAIGLNQGETAYNVGGLFYGGPLLKGATKAGTIPRFAREGAALLEQAHPGAARYFREPYEGMGSHFWPRAGITNPLHNIGLPKDVLDRLKVSEKLKLPQFLSDSPLNVQIPKGITRGEMYALHYGTDPNYYGGKIRGQVGPSGWSGGRAGLTYFEDPIRRVWYGSPDALRGTVAGSWGGGAFGHQIFGEAEDEATDNR
jgi:hypothetical protein